MNKIILIVLAIFACLYASQWTFNHVGAWIGIGFYILTIVFFGNLIVKLIKK